MIAFARRANRCIPKTHLTQRPRILFNKICTCTQRTTVVPPNGSLFSYQSSTEKNREKIHRYSFRYRLCIFVILINAPGVSLFWTTLISINIFSFFVEYIKGYSCWFSYYFEICGVFLQESPEAGWSFVSSSFDQQVMKMKNDSIIFSKVQKLSLMGPA